MNKRHPDAEQVALRRYDQIMAAHSPNEPHTRVKRDAIDTCASYVGMTPDDLQTLLERRT